MTVAAFPTTGARFSETSRCPRTTALRLQGHDPEPPTPEEETFFYRGHVYEQIVWDKLKRKYGADAVVWQREITWPLGTGHADFYIPTEKLLIEAVSATSPTPKILDFKIEQVKQYIHFDPEAEQGAVYVINPSSLEPDQLLPVLLTDEDSERIAARVAALDVGEMPERICKRPRDARGMMCPFAVACFEGWSPTPLEQFGAELDGAVMELHRAETSAKAAKANLAEVKKDVDQARRAVREYVDVDQEYESSDGIKVKVIEIAGCETYDIRTALETNAVAPELVEPFRRVGKPHERWYVEPTREIAASNGRRVEPPDDYGDDPSF